MTTTHMKDTNTFRIAVGNPMALQSSIWRFWSHKNEMYVAARESARMLKLSIHASGVWRLARVSMKEISDPLIEDKDPRVMMRWHRTEEFKTGWTKCLDVIIPEVSIKRNFALDKAGEPKGNLSWITNMPSGFKQQITLLCADSSARDIDGVTQDGDKILRQFNLNDGRIMWVISRQSKMTTSEQEYIKKFAADIKIDYESDPGNDFFAAIMIVDRDQKYPVITNFSLGWENVYIGGLQKINQIIVGSKK